MGSYAHLEIGHYEAWSWKSYVPLEPFLLFTPTDLKQSHANTDEGEIYPTCNYVTDAAHARERLDSRGLSLATLRKLYDEFRSESILDFDVATGTDHTIDNDLSFDSYLAVLRRVFESKKQYCLGMTDEYSDAEVEQIFREDFFDHELANHFFDAIPIVFIGAMIHAVPPDTLVKLDLTEVVMDDDGDSQTTTNTFHGVERLLQRRIALDYQLYGFVLEDDPNVDRRLQHRIEGLGEDHLIEYILLPLLKRMDCQRVRKVQYHGRGEFGADVLPFRHTNTLGTLEYYALQAKAVPIHATSSKVGNAAEVLSQANQALVVAFVDDLDNERKNLDKLIVACNKNITPDARRLIEEGVERKRALIFWDIEKLVDLVKKNRLTQYVLFSDFG